MFAVEKDGSTIGVLPILLRRRGPISTANYLPIPHVGPLLRDTAPLADMLAAADPFLRRQLTVSTKWAFAPGSPITAEPLHERGFQVKVDETFVIPAGGSITEHLATIPRTQRQQLLACQSLGMKGEPADIPEIKEWFADQVGSPYKSQGMVPDYSRAAVLRLVELLGTDPRMLWRSVRDNNGKLVAATANIIDTGMLSGWILVGDRSSRPSPHIIAYWDAIEWALNHGLSCDFGGAPNAGIRKFKLRIGAAPEPCLVAERVKPEVYRKLRSLHTRIVTHRANLSARQHAE
jgi:hypothetical protein